jgi:hypothetical protein
VLNIPVIRWGEEYDSLDKQEVLHFATGEAIANVSQANGGIIERDLRKAGKAREILKQFSIEQLIEMVGKAGEFFVDATLPLGRR